MYQRTANWCTPLNNAPITAEEQAQLRADFEAICETLNTSPSGFLHPVHDRQTFDDPADERPAFFEKMWSSPGFSKLTSNYTDVTVDERPTPSGASSSPRRSAASSRTPRPPRG